jgi:hypothetical protein
MDIRDIPAAERTGKQKTPASNLCVAVFSAPSALPQIDVRNKTGNV